MHAEYIWKVARYTSAAPFYFKEYENYIDGGMLANNPADIALSVIQDFYHDRGEKLPITLLVSVGTGINKEQELGEIDIRTNPLNFLNMVKVLANAVSLNSSCVLYTFIPNKKESK